MRTTYPAPVRCRAATSADWPGIAALLTAANLPLAGAREHLDHFVLAVSGSRPVGCAGLEVYGRDALLRSVAVDQTWRGRGLGTTLVAEVLGRGRQHGVARVHLLTTTAADFFARLGFHQVTQADLPAALQASEELRGACPESAVAMRLDLANAPSGTRTLAWQRLDAPGMEQLRFTGGPVSFRAEGTVITVLDGRPLRVGYAVDGAGDWSARRVRLAVDAPAGGPVELDLRADGRGGWTDGAGHALERLAGARDVDISVTPFTNTLALRRLNLAPGQAGEIQALYVDVEALACGRPVADALRVVPQRYERLDAHRYLYRSLSSGYRAVLETDDAGFVVTYPEAFVRVAACVIDTF